MLRTARRALALFVLIVIAPAAAHAHKGSPNFLSEVAPLPAAAEGLRVEMLNRDDRLLLTNLTGREVLVLGYEDEPYARIDADGTVSVNLNSPAHHLNEDRYGTGEVPAAADPGAEPRWEELSGSGRFEWHDHRAHWMGKDRPPQVTDPDVRTEVFDWKVPIEVDGERTAISGTLFWTPLPSGGVPTGALIAGAAVVIALAAAVAVVRRRRGPRDAEPAEAAW